MSLLRDPTHWKPRFDQLEAIAPACARGVFLVSPDGFSISPESASDNRYMAMDAAVETDRALAQHRRLHQQLAAAGVPSMCFSGREATPDAVFPNNVFATVRDERGARLLIGSMRHPVRRLEAERSDIVGWFRDVMGYTVQDLRARDDISELTGTLVIDRARRVGLAGLSPRCDEAGVRTMAEAFGLRAVFPFDLAEGEYHTNVVLSVLASRALVLAPGGLADSSVASALASLYPVLIELDAAEHAGFAANCLALDGASVWLSERAADALRPATQASFERAGFALRAVPLDAIEQAGGSLRCCLGEIY